jgi:hypothetical protein
MSYLEMLVNIKNLKATPQGTVKTAKSPYDSFGSSQTRRNSEKHSTYGSFGSGLSGRFSNVRFINEAAREAAEERAAIVEYDGGLQRDDAERLALDIHADGIDHKVVRPWK